MEHEEENDIVVILLLLLLLLLLICIDVFTSDILQLFLKPSWRIRL